MQEQVKDKPSWRISVYALLGVKNDLMTDNQSIVAKFEYTE